MTGYVERRFWSPMLGGEAARLSMADDRGGEYYAIMDAEGGGKAYRERRRRVLYALMDAIERGDGPGEVLGAGDAVATEG